jgi:hypothetical protein
LIYGKYFHHLHHHHLHTFERDFGSPILEIIVWQQRLCLQLFFDGSPYDSIKELQSTIY